MPSPVEVKNKYEDQLLRIPGVVGVVATEDRIVVFVESEGVRVPSSLEGIPVEKRVVGRVTTLG